MFEKLDKGIFVAKTTQGVFNRYDVNKTFTTINNALKIENEQIDITPEVKRQNKVKIGVDEDKLLFLNLGTVCERKGQIDYVNAAVEYLKGDKNAIFCLVGAREDEYLDVILDVIKSNRLEENFEIVYETKDVNSYYLAADVFVCSSYIESYPRVILEAMYFKLPIITTPTYGIKEQVISGVNGDFYPAGDARQLTTLMYKLGYNESLRKKYSDNATYALKLINSFDEMIDKYHNILQGIHFANYKGHQAPQSA